jgi:hypothetical protein
LWGVFFFSFFHFFMGPLLCLSFWLLSWLELCPPYPFNVVARRSIFISFVSFGASWSWLK